MKTDKRNLSIYFSATEKFSEISYDLKMVIRNSVEATLDYESFPYDAEVSVTLCSAEHIHSLNKEFRGVDRPTDVLSFPMYDNGVFPPDECLVGVALGDIVISVPRAKEQAAELGNSFLREVAFLTVHSTLHLLGYDHERSEEDDEKQCRIQKEIVASLKLED
jgi:probable rRNA maturation factor